MVLTVVKPATVYVDDSFTTGGASVDGDLETAGTTEAAIVGYNAFASITSAVAALDATTAGTIFINSGDYSSEAVDLTAFADDITLQFVEGNSTVGSIEAGAGDAIVLGGFDGAHNTPVTLTTGGNGGSTNIAGVISGTGGLTKTGSGTQTLTAANTYTGDTNVNDGVLELKKTFFGFGTGILDLSSNITVDNATLSLSGDESIVLIGNNVTVQNGGILSANSTGGYSHHVGALALNNGTVTSSAFGNIIINGDVTVTGSAQSTISASSINLNSGNRTFTVADTVSGVATDLLISSEIKNGSVTKAGSGTMTLSGVNTYAGVTTISEGVLRLGNKAALGADTSGTVVEDGAALDMGGTTFNASERFAEVVTINGNGIAGNTDEGAIFNSSGASLVNRGLGVVLLGSDSSVGSSAGRFDIQSIDSVSGQSFQLTKVGTNFVGFGGTPNLSKVVINGGEYGMAGNNQFDNVTNKAVEINTSGTLAIFSSKTFEANIVSNGGHILNNQGGTDTADRVTTITGTLVLNGANNRIETAPGGGTVTINLDSIVSGSGDLTKNGTGTLTVAGTNTYAGVTTISAGILKLGNQQALGSNTGKTVIEDGGTLDINGVAAANPAESIEVIGAGAGGIGAITNTGSSQGNAFRELTMTGDATFNSNNTRWDIVNNFDMGGFTLTKIGTRQVYLKSVTITNPGSVDITDGELYIETNTTFGGSGTITVRDGAQLAFNRNSFTHSVGLVLEDGSEIFSRSYGGVASEPIIEGNVSLVSGTTTINTTGGSNGIATVTLNGVVSGLGGINKISSETLTLNGDSTYTGATNVNTGTLVVNGDNSAASGAVNVANGAALAGSGSIGGVTTVVTGADLQPGENGTGTLTIDSNVIHNGDLEFDINGGASDLLRVNGDATAGDDVTLSGSVTFNTISDPTSALITVIDNDGTADTISTVFSNFAEGDDVVLGGKTYKIFYGGGDGNDVVLVDATTPTTVYVDDNFTQNNGQVIADADLGTSANQDAVFGINAFSTIADALAAVAAGGTVIVNDGTYLEDITLDGGRKLEITGPDAAGTVTIERISNTDATAEIAIEGSSTLRIGDTSVNALNSIIDGVISGSGNLEKIGLAGNTDVTFNRLTLRGTNTYTGTTTVTDGAIHITNASALGGGAGGTVVSALGQVRIDASNLTIAEKYYPDR